MRRLGLCFLAAALLVTVSRVYVGTHYVSDVLGGALTGIVAAAFVRAFYWEGTRADRLIMRILQEPTRQNARQRIRGARLVSLSFG
jgi:undecaprenyl-diphosphatase